MGRDGATRCVPRTLANKQQVSPNDNANDDDCEAEWEETRFRQRCELWLAIRQSRERKEKMGKQDVGRVKEVLLK